MHVWFMQKGFPLDADLDSLMAFFEKFGTTELVQMRRNKKKEFKVDSFALWIFVCVVCIYDVIDNSPDVVRENLYMYR